MTPKELIDKITLAAEQLESLRTEHDLSVSVQFGKDLIISTANKKHKVKAIIYEQGMIYGREVGGKADFYCTYEELVEDIKNR